MTETPEQRSRIMRAVKGRDTGPELTVRRLAHCMGYRYRLHRKDLPGKPDLMFPGRAKAIFVHGCFWHGHDCARGDRLPRTNRAYWREKIARNKERDGKRLKALRAQGITTLVLWECQLKGRAILAKRLKVFLDGRPGQPASLPPARVTVRAQPETPPKPAFQPSPLPGV